MTRPALFMPAAPSSRSASRSAISSGAVSPNSRRQKRRCLCNCAYGCPCQFNALPTKGHCEAVVGILVDHGHHGDTKLDGVKFGGVFQWPGPIHEGHGQAVPVIDDRASPAQRDAILRIMSGQDTEPGATFFQVYFSML